MWLLDDLPEILQKMDNDSITTYTKTLTLLGNKKPRSFFFMFISSYKGL